MVGSMIERKVAGLQQEQREQGGGSLVELLPDGLPALAEQQIVRAQQHELVSLWA